MLKNLYLANYAKNLKRNCYKGIDDLPIYNWWQYQSTNNPAWLLVSKREIKPIETILLHGFWQDMQEAYVKMFGFGERFEEIQEKKKEIASLITELILNDNNTLYTFIEIAEGELKELQKETKGEHNFFETKAAVDKILGFQMNIHTTSVAEFYSHIKLLEKQTPARVNEAA